MIQVKEFISTDISYAEKEANIFLADLHEEQFIKVLYDTHTVLDAQGCKHNRSAILVVYKKI